MDAAITRWKSLTPQPRIQIQNQPYDYDRLRDNWRSKDKVTKFLGLFSSKRFHTDWHAALPDENQRDTS